MKELYLILLCLNIALNSIAQEPSKPTREERVTNLSKALSVDKKKAEEIAAALDCNMDKIRATARDSSLNSQAKLELMKKLHEERQAKINATLSPEQLATMQAKTVPLMQAQRAGMEQLRTEQLKKKTPEKGNKQEEKSADKQP